MPFKPVPDIEIVAPAAAPPTARDIVPFTAPVLVNTMFFAADSWP
jgi:hypothetical protein